MNANTTKLYSQISKAIAGLTISFTVALGGFATVANFAEPAVTAGTGWDSASGPGTGWDSANGPGTGWDSANGPGTGWD